MPGVTGIIVAGGASSRMGQDKALLEIDGRSQLERTMKLLKSSGCEEVIVSRNDQGFIEDTIANRGPLGGVLSSLPYCNYEYVVIVPVDMPLLTLEVLRFLMEQKCASYFSRTPLPCLLPNNEKLADYLLQQLSAEDGNRSVRGLLEYMQARPFEWQLTYQLQNTNTPQQWHQALQYLGEVS